MAWSSRKNNGTMDYCEYLHLLHDALLNPNTFVVCRRPNQEIRDWNSLVALQSVGRLCGGCAWANQVYAAGREREIVYYHRGAKKGRVFLVQLEIVLQSLAWTRMAKLCTPCRGKN